MSGNYQGTGPQPNLLNALRSSDPMTLRNAALALKRTRNPAELANLRSALHDQTNTVVRTNAVRTVGLIGDTQFLDDLYITLNDREELSVGKETVLVLMQFGRRDAVSHLCRPLRFAKEPSLRKLVAKALGQLGSPESLDCLFDALDPQKERITSVRVEAASALGKIGQPRAVSALSKTALNDRERDVRGAAIEALGQIGNNDAILVMLRVLIVRDVSLRNKAALALARFPPGRFKGITQQIDAPTIADMRGILQQGGGGDEDVCRITVRVLGVLKDPSAIPELCNALDAKYESVRIEADSALVYTGPAAEPALRNALDFQRGVPYVNAKALPWFWER